MKLLIYVTLSSMLFWSCVPEAPKNKSKVTFTDQRLQTNNLIPTPTSTPTSTPSPTATSGGSNTSATFSMLLTKCGGCHNGPSYGGFGSMDLNTMISERRVIPGDPENSRLYIRIVDGSMPPGNPLSLNEISAVHTWIKDELASSVTATPTPNLPADSYASLRVNVFLPKCIGCHNNTDKFTRGAGYSMETYSELMNKITPYNVNDSEAWVKSYDQEMPPNKNNILTNAELADFASWINKGASEN